MANRHLLRTIALQSLFEWDFHDRSGNLDEIFDRVCNEFAPRTENSNDNLFAKELLDGVVKNQVAIDEIITKNAPEWPIEQITIIDRNVLRLGIYEMMFIKDTPARVVINEAVEMGKSFGGESSGKFVNGVLGTLYKALPPDQINDSEPAKDETKE
jgi:N utilization substance protein B